jgi:hypothetical protein
VQGVVRRLCLLPRLTGDRTFRYISVFGVSECYRAVGPLHCAGYRAPAATEREFTSFYAPLASELDAELVSALEPQLLEALQQD